MRSATQREHLYPASLTTWFLTSQLRTQIIQSIFNWHVRFKIPRKNNSNKMLLMYLISCMLKIIIYNSGTHISPEENLTCGKYISAEIGQNFYGESFKRCFVIHVVNSPRNIKDANLKNDNQPSAPPPFKRRLIKKQRKYLIIYSWLTC